MSEAVKGQNVFHHRPGPNEKKALQLLGALSGLELPNEDEKDILKAATDAIKNARFQPLQRRLVKLFNSNRKKPRLSIGIVR